MSFLCEYNIKTSNVWDKYSENSDQNSVPNRLKKKRPNSKLSQFNSAIQPLYKINKAKPTKTKTHQSKVVDRVKPTTSKPSTAFSTTSSTTPTKLTTFFSIIDTEPEDYHESSDEIETKVDTVSPVTLSIVKVIQTIFTLAFQ